MKIKSLLVICAAISIVFTGLSPAIAADPLVVGVLHSESHPYAGMMKNSMEMAADAINKDGGINGRPLKLVYEDDREKADVGEKSVRKLVKDKKAVMLIGGYSSKNTLQMAVEADKQDRPLLVCTAADDRVTQRGLENVYRLNPPASEYTAGLEDFFLKKIKPKSMAIVYENSPYGTGGAIRMMWFCRENGIDIRRIVPYHREKAKPHHDAKIKENYFSNIVSPLKKNAPDVIYMVSYYNDGVELVKQIRKAGINSLLCGGAGGFTHPQFFKTAGEQSQNLVTVSLWHGGVGYPGAKEYIDSYMKKYSVKPDYHGAEAYSAVLVAADALKRAGSHKPEKIRAALGKTNMNTPFGPVVFYSYGNSERQNSIPTFVMQIVDGKLECIWPENSASAKFVSPKGWR